MKSMGFSADDLNLFLNNKCGLLGVSEASEDMRILVQKDSDGDVGAKRAIDALVYQIKKQIGSLFAVLGGLDAIVFTATMGERSNIVRARVCEGLGALGIEIDRVKNDEMISREGFINSDSSKVAIAVIKTDEMGEMFEEVKMY
jgi:acetate kinase